MLVVAVAVRITLHLTQQRAEQVKPEAVTVVLLTAQIFKILQLLAQLLTRVLEVEVEELGRQQQVTAAQEL
jgi:hypothetical protein